MLWKPFARRFGTGLLGGALLLGLGACGDDDAVSTPTPVAPTTVPAALATSVRPAPPVAATATPTPPSTAATATRASTSPAGAALDKTKFYQTLPTPADAQIVPVTEGIDIAFRTRETEPAMITLYTNWIAAQGWTKTTELPYLQPNERWTKGGYEFVVYIVPKGAAGVATISIQVRPQTAP